MTERKVSTQIPVIFQNVEKYEKEDTRFLKVKIWLMHTGQNLNGSSFSKEVVDKAIPTLANTPILSFIEENSAGEQDFSDHRIVLHKNDDGEFNFKYLGSAVGVIPEVNNAHWETRVTDSGEEKEYLVVDALMWTKWGDPTDIMNRKGITSQSMELAENYSGSFDDKGLFHFESFSFFGACLLGDDVSPAMQSSTVEVQFSKNEDLQNTIENKLNEFYTLFSQEGGTKMEEVTSVEETVEIEEVVESTEVEPTQEFDILSRETTDEDLEAHEEAKEDAETDKQDTEVEVESTELVVELVDYEAKFNELSAEFTKLQSQLTELTTYKREREESDIKAKFADKLSEEEFAQVFESMKDAEIQDVEDKLFALYGKKNFSISSSNTSTQVNKVTLALPKEEEATRPPYGGLFEKYKDKQEN